VVVAYRLSSCCLPFRRKPHRPFLEAKEFMGGFYVVECATRERAIELAGLIPDSAVDGLGVEVRPIVYSAGPR
jgi:hypothetical protein